MDSQLSLSNPRYIPLLFITINTMGSLYLKQYGNGRGSGCGFVHHLHAVSSSIPENPKALSPWIQNTGGTVGVVCETRAAAIAKPHPTPIVPNVPASNLYR